MLSRLLCASLISLLSTIAIGQTETVDLEKNPIFSTSVGFGIATDSSPSLSDHVRTGTNIFLDVWKMAGEDLAIGIRTIASGSLASNTSYQRLASGILVSLNLPWDLRLAVSHGQFSESGKSAGHSNYVSNGALSSVSILKPLIVKPFWQLNSFTHWSNHSGEFSTLATAITTESARSGSTRGSTRGIAVSFEIPVKH